MTGRLLPSSRGGKLCEDTATLLTHAREGFRVRFPNWMPTLQKALGRQAKGMRFLGQRDLGGPCGLSHPCAVLPLHSALLSLTPSQHRATPAQSQARSEPGLQALQQSLWGLPVPLRESTGSTGVWELTFFVGQMGSQLTSSERGFDTTYLPYPHKLCLAGLLFLPRGLGRLW